jgi:hypothetical protein
MKTYNDLLEIPLAIKVRTLAKDIIEGRHSGLGIRMWTNYAWDKSIVQDSAVVLCIQMPDDIIQEIENVLIDKDILNLEIHERITLTKKVMAYAWTKNSYIPEHNDGIYSKAVTIYLNESWTYNDGGLFTWMDPSDTIWKTISPIFNRAVVNDSGFHHGITPVKSDSPRITLQIFLDIKN